MEIKRNYLRIGFAIRDYKNPSTIPIIKIESDFDITKQHYLYGFYNTIKAISNNESLIKEVRQIRKKLNIPECGLDYFKSKNFKINADLLDEEIKRIYREYEFTAYLKFSNTICGETCNLENIILYSFVIPISEEQEIVYHPFIDATDEEDSSYVEEKMSSPGLVLKIHKPVKIYTLFKFIREKWARMEKDMARIKVNNGRFFPLENLEILELVNDKKLAYKYVRRNLSKSLRKKIRTTKYNLPKDTIKMRYKRSMKKVNKLFFKK